MRSLPPQSASQAKPVQVVEVTSELMENNVEVVEELLQLPPPQTGAITKPGDITSTTNNKLGSLPILDLTEEPVRINNVCEEAAQAANEYVAKMNNVGVFLESLGSSAYRTSSGYLPNIVFACICTVLQCIGLYVL